MPEQKPFKYYAIRMGDTILIRRTLIGLKKVVSKLYKPGTNFSLTQVTYSGGIIIGSIPYRDWTRFGGPQIANHLKVTKELVSSMKPYIMRVKHGV